MGDFKIVEDELGPSLELSIGKKRSGKLDGGDFGMSRFGDVEEIYPQKRRKGEVNTMRVVKGANAVSPVREFRAGDGHCDRNHNGMANASLQSISSGYPKDAYQRSRPHLLQPTPSIGHGIRNPRCSEKVRAAEERLAAKMPCVSARGKGPCGRTVMGFLYSYTENEVSIMCLCHGRSFSPAQFVEHAGALNVSNPLRHITIHSSLLY